MDLAALQLKINNYITVVSSWVRNVGKLYFSGTPENVTVDMIDDNGNLTTSTLPNVAQFRKTVWDDVGGAIGQFSRTFYVDEVNGDDNNDGSSSNPFKTLSKATDSTSLGGTVNIYLMSDIYMNYFVDCMCKRVYISYYEERRTITQKTYESGDYAYLYSFKNYAPSNIKFNQIDIVAEEYTGDKAINGAIFYSYSNIAFYMCNIFASNFPVYRAWGATRHNISIEEYVVTYQFTTDTKRLYQMANNMPFQITRTSVTILDKDGNSLGIDDYGNSLTRDADSGNPINILSNTNFSS